MALILVFHNTQKDKGPLKEDANYDVTVLIGDGSVERTTPIARQHIEHHKRSDGWKALVQQFLNECE